MGAHLHCSPSLLAIVEYEILIESFRICFSVEQEKAEKADQNPEHRTENSEPEWNVQLPVRDGIRLCFGHLLFPRQLFATRGNPKASSVSVLRLPVTRKPWSL